MNSFSIKNLDFYQKFEMHIVFFVRNFSVKGMKTPNQNVQEKGQDYGEAEDSNARGDFVIETFWLSEPLFLGFTCESSEAL